MNIDPQFALTVALPLARAAYGHDVDVNPPTGWTDCFLIQPDYFGFVGKNGGGLGISFRGTETEQEWAWDFAAIPTANKFGQGTVHRGFQEIYQRIRPAVVPAIDKTSEILIVGHSLGGALALLCAADLSNTGRSVSVVSFAAPRVGKKDFCSWAGKNIKACLNLLNVYDVVPRLPIAQDGWMRPGNDVLLHPGAPQVKSLRDFLGAAHALDAYREGLEKFDATDSAITRRLIV